jgi:phospholipid/cholesterol/gamma-HCH transport system substrate-binding protein
MKKNISSKIRLGIFITVGIAVFIAAIYFIGEKQHLFRSTFRLSGVFEDVAGLQAGNNVRLSGINVGTIENIVMISDTSVRVEILVDESIRKFIKKDAIAVIGSEGLMGNKILIINPGTGGKKIIENNDVLQTTPPINMDDILISFKSTLDNASSITSDLSTITNNIQSGKGTIGRLIMDKSWRENFDSTFANLTEGSARFVTLMDKEMEVDAILLELKSTIKNTADITGDLSKITHSLQSGEGTIGRLLMNSSGAENFDSTMVNIKEGTGQLKLLLEKARGSWLLGGF